VSPRTYSSPKREAEAARTRATIVDAAAALFSRDGYPATTMKAIAAEAGVSVQSVHLAGSKAALLIAAFERTFAGDEGRHSLSERPAMVEILARSELADVIDGWLDFVAAANKRTARISRAMTIAAEIDPLAAEVVADLDARRRRDLGLAAGWAVGRGLLAPARADQAADELNYLVGPETYDFFVLRSRWSDERYRAWMRETLSTLFARWQSESDHGEAGSVDT
jgi:AcrR family transcriptional regulator